MRKKVKVGIIGLGFMGTTHFQIHKQLGKSDIIAVADVDEKKISGDWSCVVGNIGDMDYSKSVDMSGIAAYTDAMKLISNPEIELVDICVPTYLHEKFPIVSDLFPTIFVFVSISKYRKPLSNKRVRPISLNSSNI